MVLPLELVVAGGGVMPPRVAPVMTETRMTRRRATASITRVLLRTPYLGSSIRQKIRHTEATETSTRTPTGGLACKDS